MDEKHDTVEGHDETAVDAAANKSADVPGDSSVHTALDDASDATSGNDAAGDGGSGQTLTPTFLTREEYEKVGDDPAPLPRGFEVIDGGTSSWPASASFKAEDAAAPSAPEPAFEPVRETADGSDDDSSTADNADDGPSAAQVVGSFISEGVGAVREVNAAKRAHASAREHLDYLQRTIEDQQEELAHRRDIISRYELIMDEQTSRQDEAHTRVATAQQQQDAARARIEELKEQLQRMRDDDTQVEKRLKAAVESAEARESSSREAGARMQRRLDDAKRALQVALSEEETAIAAAEHAVKSAAARLDALNEEKRELERNPSANTAAYSVRSGELELDISDACAQLRDAENALPTTRDEVERSVSLARAAVAEAQEPIEAAKRAHEAVTNEADEARDALDSAKNEAAERQRALRDHIAEQEKEVKKLDRLIDDARAEANEAQAVMDEATEIRNHPEVIESLAIDLERNLAEGREQAQEVEQLAATERDVRERTRSSRLRFLGALGIVLIAVLIGITLWFALS